MTTTWMEVEVSAEEVVSKMTEDAAFATAIWHDINERWFMGMMLDDFMDIVNNSFTNEEKQRLISSLDVMSQCVKMQVEMDA